MITTLEKSKGKLLKNLKKNLSESSSYSKSSSDEYEKKKKKETFLSQNEIEQVRLTRNFKKKYCEIPIFDKKIEGYFVKINNTASSRMKVQGISLLKSRTSSIIRRNPPM
jgi:hypothetical protein